MNFRKYLLFLFAFVGTHPFGYAQFTIPLFIPDTLSGPNPSLTMTAGQKNLLSGPLTQTLSYNNVGYLGPTLIFRKGQEINAMVMNNTSDTTTLHWHGLHLPAHADGGPHMPVLPMAMGHAHFTCKNAASTNWYHPHFHGKTGEQTMKGAAGMIIVRDAEERALALPRTYGKDDFPIILQSMEFDPANQILHKGMRDSILLVNGTRFPFLSAPAQWVRLRMLNASNARNFLLGFEGNRPFKIIGTDGGLLGKHLERTRAKLAPGERMEILVDLSGLQNQSLRLKSFGSEIPAGTQGGPLSPAPPGTPSMESPLNGADFDLLEIRIGSPLPDAITIVPDSLAQQNRLSVNGTETERLVVFSSATPGSPVGPFLLNDSTFNMERIDFRIPVGSTEIWTIHNQTVVAHPFHLHGFSFFVLDRYGALVDPEERGAKDMVLVGPNESLRIITRFSEFADSTMPYMFHCHILTHEDEGMMGQFVVTPVLTEGKQALKNEVQAWPNPFRHRLNFPDLPSGTRLRAINSVGRIFYEGEIPRSGLNTSAWPAGMYVLRIGNGAMQRFVKH